MIEAFEGNKVETITFLPSLRAFQEALQFPEVTVAADTGMLSAWRTAHPIEGRTTVHHLPEDPRCALCGGSMDGRAS